MTLRYSIVGKMYGSEDEVEIAQVATNPQQVAAAARQKKLKVTGTDGRRINIDKYCSVRVIDNEGSPA